MTDANSREFSRDERRLVIRAVAAYSDSCHPPELTPNCPFYELTEQGPVCAEQCRDLVAENAAELPRPETLPLGGSLAAQRRPTPRHGPKEGEPAFDCGQVRLEDSDKPVPQRRLTALMADLENSLSSQADDNKKAPGEELLVELRKRGVDVDPLIRVGLANTVRTGVLVLALSAERSGSAKGQQWADLLDELVPPGEPGGKDSPSQLVDRLLSERFMGMLNYWIQNAPLEDLACLTPPISQALRRGRRDEVPPEPPVEMTWFIERFTETYLRSWSLSSLNLEWRYQHMLKTGCASAASMRERRIDKADLATFIADSSVSQWEHSLSEKSGPVRQRDDINVRQFMPVALSALNEGRRDDAVSLYRSIVILHDDAEVHNNLGFCLLPDNPREALDHLTIAAEDPEYINRAVPMTNCALAYLMLGQCDTGLSYIDRALDFVHPGDSVWMWPLTGPKDRTTDQIDLVDYILELQSQLELLA